MALTKADLAANLVDSLGMERHEARAIVELFFETIRIALIRGETVKLSGFGKFRILDKHARPARNPRTGQPATVSERRVVSFMPGHLLKKKVQRD